MNIITQYINNTERRKVEVIPGTFDLTFKLVFSSEREYLADIVNGITEIPKKIVEEKALIINSEHVIENIEEDKRTSDLVIEVDNNIINIEINRSYY